MHQFNWLGNEASPVHQTGAQHRNQKQAIMNHTFQWQCASFDELSGKQVYAILQARTEVFVVEQRCVYMDMDGDDFAALHLTVWTQNHEIAAYLRILAPHTQYPEPSLGRILTTSRFRGMGLGQQLMVEGLRQLELRYSMQPVRINAQARLQDFYRAFGFVTMTEEYMEDGIAHVQMLRSPSP